MSIHLRGWGKPSDTSKEKGLKLSATKECTQEMFISNNLQGFPCTTLEMEWGVAFITFDPWGVIQVKIDRLSARGDAGSPDAVERGQPYTKQYISS